MHDNKSVAVAITAAMAAVSFACAILFSSDFFEGPRDTSDMAASKTVYESVSQTDRDGFHSSINAIPSGVTLTKGEQADIGNSMCGYMGLSESDRDFMFKKMYSDLGADAAADVVLPGALNASVNWLCPEYTNDVGTVIYRIH